MADPKRRLLAVLDRRVFEPVLAADENEYPSTKREALRQVKDATRRERERFESYGSAEHVYRMFHDELSSEAAADVNRTLRELDLPTLEDCRDDFDHTARELGIRAG